jgi:hypothetical protein
MQKLSVTILLITGLLLLAACGGSRRAQESAGPSETAETESGAGAAASQEESQPEAEPPQPQPVSYSQDIAPLFVRHGCVDCHHPTNAVKVDLTRPFHPELGIINRPNTWTRSEKKLLVVPGDPDASALVLKVERTDLEPKVDGDPMPWNIPPLTEGELASLRSWIEAGARNDATFPPVARIFGDGVSLGSRGGKCAYCHHSGAPYGPDLTAVFDPESGAVNVPAARGGVRVVPGDVESSVLYLRSSGRTLPPRLQPPMPKHFPRLTDEEVQLIRDWIAEGAQNN